MNVVRPIKRGNMRRYVDVLSVLAPSDVTVDAAEMDADLDTIYGHTIGTADLVDGAVTTPKLANGAVTSVKLGGDATPLWRVTTDDAVGIMPIAPRNWIRLPVDGSIYFGGGTSASLVCGIWGDNTQLNFECGTNGFAWRAEGGTLDVMRLTARGALWLPASEPGGGGSLFFASDNSGLWGNATALGFRTGTAGYEWWGPGTAAIMTLNADGGIWLPAALPGMNGGTIWFGDKQSGLWGSPGALGFQCGANGFEWWGSAGANEIATLSNVGDLRIWGANATKATGTTWINPSDPKLKTDVAPYRAGLAELCRLDPVSYHLKAQPAGPTCYGFDAEAVRAVLPECVGTTTLDGAEVLTLDMHPMLVAMVGALKELAGRVAALEAPR